MQDIAPSYFEVIKKPMSLSVMDAKLARGEYKCTQMIREDYELMVRNALYFNGQVSNFKARTPPLFTIHGSDSYQCVLTVIQIWARSNPLFASMPAQD